MLAMLQTKAGSAASINARAEHTVVCHRPLCLVDQALRRLYDAQDPLSVVSPLLLLLFFLVNLY